MTDPELAALVEQAARNLETLELLARGAAEQDPGRIEELRQRLHDLHLAYVHETDVLTQQVLLHAMERRTYLERRERDRRGPHSRQRKTDSAEIAQGDAQS